MPEKEIERSPDKQPAHGGFVVEDRGADVVCVMRVRGFGALVIRGIHGTDRADWHGVSVFTDEQLQFTDAPL